MRVFACFNEALCIGTHGGPLVGLKLKSSWLSTIYIDL